ncbi:MAG: hypothetical protein L0Y72_14965 [Gemmataceae bacterium]|nr:hypothetical protein [Gemmataceae bacterium]MCI0740344.1 hypothetical protein [Gemmataceae bacterium]
MLSSSATVVERRFQLVRGDIMFSVPAAQVAEPKPVIWEAMWTVRQEED